jgi:hypothetical protein
MFAGTDTKNLVLQNSNSMKNVMIIEENAHSAHEILKWAIEAEESNGTVRT